MSIRNTFFLVTVLFTLAVDLGCSALKFTRIPRDYEIASFPGTDEPIPGPTDADFVKSEPQNHGRTFAVRSKYSSGFAVLVFQLPAEPHPAPNITPGAVAVL